MQSKAVWRDGFLPVAGRKRKKAVVEVNKDIIQLRFGALAGT
jgi:hypothetical protein